VGIYFIAIGLIVFEYQIHYFNGDR